PCCLKLAAFKSGETLPFLRVITGKAALVAEHESPFVFRRRTTEKVPLVVEKKRRSGKSDGHFCKSPEQHRPEVIENDDSALVLLFVEDRCGEANARLERPLDLWASIRVLGLLVQIERRHEDLAPLQVHCLLEIVTVGLVLKLCLWHDDG